MRNFIAFICISATCLCFPIRSQGQYIQSLTVFPANPTTADTITVIADCAFPAGSCDESTQTLFVAGNQVFASALHCIGLLTVICYDTDTFKIDPLAAGTYTFHFQLDAGGLPSPCTPGIVPGPGDSIAFVVSPAVGSAEMITQDAISVFPNPARNQIGFSGFEDGDFPAKVALYSIDGKRELEETLNDKEALVEITSLPDGHYQISVTCSNGRQVTLPMLKSSGR
jgi:hypothetical protein